MACGEAWPAGCPFHVRKQGPWALREEDEPRRLAGGHVTAVGPRRHAAVVGGENFEKTRALFPFDVRGQGPHGRMDSLLSALQDTLTTSAQKKNPVILAYLKIAVRRSS